MDRAEKASEDISTKGRCWVDRAEKSAKFKYKKTNYYITVHGKILLLRKRLE
jgi:hypothetical protein